MLQWWDICRLIANTQRGQASYFSIWEFHLGWETNSISILGNLLHAMQAASLPFTEQGLALRCDSTAFVTWLTARSPRVPAAIHPPWQLLSSSGGLVPRLTSTTALHPSSLWVTLVLLWPRRSSTWGSSHHDRRAIGRGCPTWPRSSQQKDLQRPTRGSYCHHLGPFSPSFQSPPRQHHQLGTSTPSRLAHSVSHNVGRLLLCAKPTGFLQRLKASRGLLPPNADTGVGYCTIVMPSHDSIPKNAWSAKTIVGGSGLWTSPKFLYSVTPS